MAKLGPFRLTPRCFMHVVCVMNGNVDDAIYWIRHAKTTSG